MSRSISASRLREPGARCSSAFRIAGLGDGHLREVGWGQRHCRVVVREARRRHPSLLDQACRELPVAGLAAGILNLVPYVGSILATIAAVLAAFIQTGDYDLQALFIRIGYAIQADPPVDPEAYRYAPRPPVRADFAKPGADRCDRCYEPRQGPRSVRRWADD